ncbi:hypothetical protein FA702_05520 [Novosphingobium sp. EMRT-2]|nr:hypothetical protein FA702_05520 [Novosphingobium sp. EMRT-2]
MLVDHALFRDAPRTSRPSHRHRTAGERLWHALRALAGAGAVLVSQRETPWASVTFSGARHSFTLRFDEADAIEDSERLIAALPEHPFHIPGHLVADASVARADHSLLPAPRLELDIDILLLEAS